MRAGVVYALAAVPLAVMSCAPTETDPPDSDLDDDGYADVDDCEPENASVHPGATEVCDNALDDDCSGGAPECRRTGLLSMDEADAFIDGDSPGDCLGGMVRALGDLNADGADEFYFTAGGVGDDESQEGLGYYIVGGGGALPATQAGVWATIPREGLLSSSLAGVGDVDGDGTSDLGAARWDDEQYVNVPVVFTSMGPGERAVAEGEAVAVDSVPDSIYGVVGGSDLSGDGVIDLALMGVEANYMCEGPVASSNLWASTCTGTIKNGDQGRASEILVSADLDGDGIGEVVLTYSSWCPDPDSSEPSDCYKGLVRVVLGPVTGDVSWEQSDALLVGETYSSYLGHAVDLGDIDGDGFDEIAAGAGGDAGAVYFIGVDDLKSSELTNVEAVFRDSDAPSLSEHWTPADFDGDGINDLGYRAKATDPVVAASDKSLAQFIAYGPIGLSLEPSFEVNGSSTMYAVSAIGAGDLDGDGHGELLIANSGYGNPYLTADEFYAYGRIAVFFGAGL